MYQNSKFKPWNNLGTFSIKLRVKGKTICFLSFFLHLNLGTLEFAWNIAFQTLNIDLTLIYKGFHIKPWNIGTLLYKSKKIM